MPLVRARCGACSEPLADPPYVTLPVRCASCGVGTNVEMAADGHPTQFDAAFSPLRLVRWFGFARDRMARAILGVAVGTCARCNAPLVLAPADAVSLPCPHCKSVVTGPASDVLVDQWPEPWAKVSSAAMELEYRLALLDDTGVLAGCAACGLSTPPTDPSMQCRRCNAAIWTKRGEGPRMQLGVRVDGTRSNRPFNALVPVIQGEMMLRTDAALDASAESGRSLLGITGIGCAIAVGVAMLFVLSIVLFVYLK